MNSHMKRKQKMKVVGMKLKLIIPQMAGKYLVLQQEIFNLRQRKTALEEKLSQAEKLERIGNQRYQHKIQELESKRVCCSLIVLDTHNRRDER